MRKLGSGHAVGRFGLEMHEALCSKAGGAAAGDSNDIVNQIEVGSVFFSTNLLDPWDWCMYIPTNL